MCTALISHLLNEEGSELGYAEVADCNRFAYKRALILLDALQMHEADSMGEHPMNELLVSCYKQFFACKKFLIFLIDR